MKKIFLSILNKEKKKIVIGISEYCSTFSSRYANYCQTEEKAIGFMQSELFSSPLIKSFENYKVSNHLSYHLTSPFFLGSTVPVESDCE